MVFNLIGKFPTGTVFLDIPQLCVKPFLPDKFIVRTFFPDFSVVQDNNPVGVLNGFKSVGNGYHGTSFDERVDGFLHFHFA